MTAQIGGAHRQDVGAAGERFGGYRVGVRACIAAFDAVAGRLPQPPKQLPSAFSGGKTTVSQNHEIREIREKENAVQVSTGVNQCQPVSTGDTRWEKLKVESRK